MIYKAPTQETIQVVRGALREDRLHSEGVGFEQLTHLIDGTVDAALLTSWAKLLNQRHQDLMNISCTDFPNIIFFSSRLYSTLTGYN